MATLLYRVNTVKTTRQEATNRVQDYFGKVPVTVLSPFVLRWRFSGTEILGLAELLFFIVDTVMGINFTPCVSTF